MLSSSIQLSADGTLVQPGQSPVLWLRCLIHRVSVLIQEGLTCKVAVPLDHGESIGTLCHAIQKFMPENFMPAMATPLPA